MSLHRYCVGERVYGKQATITPVDPSHQFLLHQGQMHAALPQHSKGPALNKLHMPCVRAASIRLQQVQGWPCCPGGRISYLQSELQLLRCRREELCFWNVLWGRPLQIKANAKAACQANRWHELGPISSYRHCKSWGMSALHQKAWRSVCHRTGDAETDVGDSKRRATSSSSSSII